MNDRHELEGGEDVHPQHPARHAAAPPGRADTAQQHAPSATNRVTRSTPTCDAPVHPALSIHLVRARAEGTCVDIIRAGRSTGSWSSGSDLATEVAHVVEHVGGAPHVVDLA
jgi:hypothetical protein